MKKLLSCILLVAMCLTIFAGCVAKTSKELDSAKAYLYNMYKDGAVNTPSDYTLVGALIVEGVSYDLEWTVEVTSGDANGVKVTKSEDGKTVTVDVDEKAAAEIAYKLTATITDANGKSVTITFDRKVPTYRVNTFAEYMAAAANDNIAVQGIVSGIIAKSKGASYNCVYVQDETEGGYYVYGMDKDPVTDLNLEVGLRVEVSGLKDIYNGTHELKDATITVLSTEKVAVTPKDLTAAYKNAADLKDASITGLQGMLVTIKGAEITTQGDNGYYRFALAGKESYVRISSSTCALTADEQTAFIDAHTNNAGYLADVTGVVSVYNDAFYLCPVDANAFANFTLPPRTDDGKVAFELSQISLIDHITKNTTIQLPTPVTYDEVLMVWSLVDNACATLENGELTVTLPEDAATTVTLKLTVACGNVLKTVTYEIEVDMASKDQYIAKPVATPVAGTAYKFAYYQAQLGKYLYFNGGVDSYYFGTTDNVAMAVDVYMETVEGGVRFYFMDGETKTYLDIYQNGNYVNLRLTAEPTGVYTYDETLKTYVATFGEKSYYLGTYGNKTDLRCSETKYISGDNAEDVGVSQYVAALSTLAPALTVANPVEASKADTAYKFAYYQAQLGKYLYFNGAVDGYYFGTTDNAEMAVDVYMETVEGGVRFYFMDGETKTYLDIYQNGNYVNLRLTAEPTGVYTYDETLKTYVATFGEKSYYLGTYGDKTDLRCSETKYISGDNAENVGVSQYVAALSTLGLKEVAPVAVETPEADTAYKFAYYQAQLGKYLYFNGAVDGYYFGTTDQLSKAVDVYMETVEGGVRFYFMDGETKTYLDIYQNGNYVNLRLTAEPTGVYTYDETLKTYVATFGEKSYYLGTYGNKTDLRCSETKYISGDNAEDVGVSQYVVALSTIEFVEDAE